MKYKPYQRSNPDIEQLNPLWLTTLGTEKLQETHVSLIFDECDL